MAEHLASIFGTEKDRVNCPFYLKIGACRHGDRCSRLHTKPTSSPTLLLSNMYQRPDMLTPGPEPNQSQQNLDPAKVQEHFDDFYEDLYEELRKYGEIQSLNICDNLADHMVGNVYVQFKEEDHASKALMNLNGRSIIGEKQQVGHPCVRFLFYCSHCKMPHSLRSVEHYLTKHFGQDESSFKIPDCSATTYQPLGRPIIVEFSPVTDFREATCRQYEENVCNRGGYCNFMHLKKISRDLRRKLFGRGKQPQYGDNRSRSRSPPRQRNHDDRPYGGQSFGGRGFGRRDYERDRRHHDRSRRPRSRSPGQRIGRNRSPGTRGNRSPVRESSEERRAKIEMWNREKDQGESFDKNDCNDNSFDDRGHAQNGDQYDSPQHH